VAVVGIDLGTTNTVVGVVQNGQARALRDSSGEHLIPSVVSFHENGSVLVGRTAKERRIVDAASTVYSIKRLIGRSWHSEEVGRARTRFPFEMREGPGQAALVVARNETFTLPEISAFVLRHAKALAEVALGEPVDRAVITVPANFNDLQRAATKVAGRVAGLEVLRILNEPTAAALAYGYGKGKGERVVIYDFGGGTFDVTLLDLSGNVFEVLATAGNTFLGGDDIDLAVAERMADACAELHRIDARQNAQIFERLRYYAEKLKVLLSAQLEATITVPDVGIDGGPALPLDFSLTRAELERLAAPMVERSFEVCADALGVARLGPHQFDQVVLVGGSTRLPMVRSRVAQYFGRPPLDRINPDEVVAIGAAIQATALTYAERRRSVIPKPPMPAARSLEGSTAADKAGRRRSARPVERPSGAPPGPRSQLDFDPALLRARSRQGIVVPSPRTSRPPPLPTKKPGSTRPAPFGSDRPAPGRKGGTLGGVGSSPLHEPPPAPADPFVDLDSEPTQVKAASAGSFFTRTPGERLSTDDEPTRADTAYGEIEKALASEIPPGEPLNTDLDLPEIDFPDGPDEDEVTTHDHRFGQAAGDAARRTGPRPRGRTTAPGVGAQSLPTNPGFAAPELPLDAAPPVEAHRETSTPRASVSPEPALPAPGNDPLPPLDLPPLVSRRAPRRSVTQISGAVAPPEAPSEARGAKDPFLRPEPFPFEPAAAEARALSRPPMESRAPLPLLVDVTPLSLCVETVGGFRDVIVERNTPVPCEQSHVFVTAQDLQDSVRVRVGQGESGRFVDNTVLGELELLGLRPAQRGEVRVVVTFALDTSGMLDVRAVDDETGKIASARLRLVGAPDASEVGRMTERGRARQTR
jgi:molecular chaperone DnaK